MLLVTKSLTLMPPTVGAPRILIFGFLRGTSSYFRDMTLIVTRVTLILYVTCDTCS